MSSSNDSPPPTGSPTSDFAMAAAARSRRRVCNLTPSQVEKKRAIDRTNQQHWRQKKRLYIAELEAEVARLQASLDESQAKLRVYETADNSGSNAGPVGSDMEELADEELPPDNGRFQRLPSPAQSHSGFDAGAFMSAVSALSTLSSLPSLMPATSGTMDTINNGLTLSATGALPLGSDASSPISNNADPGYILDGAATSSGTASAPADIGWPMTVATSSSSPRTHTTNILQTAQHHAQTHDNVGQGLDIFDAARAFSLFDNDINAVSSTDESFFSTSQQQPLYTDLSNPGVSSAIDRHYLGQQQQYYGDAQRYHTYGTGSAPSPSPLLTGLNYVPYYLEGRHSLPSPNMPDWMSVPLNLPVSTELDKLILITAQALIQRYSAHEFNQPMFPNIEGLLSLLRTDNTPAATSAAAAAAAPSTPDGFRHGPVGTTSPSRAGGLEEFFRAAGTASNTVASQSAPSSSSTSSASSPPQTSADPPSMSPGPAQRPILAAVVSHVVWISPIKRLPGRLAFLYIIAVFMRWCLCPTKEHYDALPAFLRPTPLQRRVPHPVWVDLIIWPDVRDDLIRGGDYSAFELFRYVMGNTVTMNWPYPDASTIMPCADGKRLALNPVFEAHIRDMANYTVGPQATNAFPALGRYVRVNTHESR